MLLDIPGFRVDGANVDSERMLCHAVVVVEFDCRQERLNLNSLSSQINAKYNSVMLNCHMICATHKSIKIYSTYLKLTSNFGSQICKTDLVNRLFCWQPSCLFIAALFLSSTQYRILVILVILSKTTFWALSIKLTEQQHFVRLNCESHLFLYTLWFYDCHIQSFKSYLGSN